MGNDTYEAYERAVEEQLGRNDTYLDEFEAWLLESGLKEKTIQNHLRNVEFFINDYLQREGASDVEEGCQRVDDFLGYFFIRKCMWSTPSSIRQNAASLKKFYKCMVEKGHVGQRDLDLLLATIKEQMPLWIEDCEKFNDPSYDYFGEESRELFGEESQDYGSPFGLEGIMDSDLFTQAYEAVARSLGLDYLLGEAPDDPDDVDEEELEEEKPFTRQEAIEMLTLALLYLTSNEVPTAGGVREAATSLDAEALRLLCDDGLITLDETGSKATISGVGLAMAQVLLETMSIDYLMDDAAESDSPQSHLRLV